MMGSIIFFCHSDGSKVCLALFRIKDRQYGSKDYQETITGMTTRSKKWLASGAAAARIRDRRLCTAEVSTVCAAVSLTTNTLIFILSTCLKSRIQKRD